MFIGKLVVSKCYSLNHNTRLYDILYIFSILASTKVHNRMNKTSLGTDLRGQQLEVEHIEESPLE